MYSKEIYYQTQPQFDEQTKEQIQLFEKIKDFGPFKQGLIMCLIDIAILQKNEQNKSDTFKDLCKEIRKCSYSPNSTIVSKMNEFSNSLDYVALTHKQSYEFLHVIKDPQQVQEVLTQNFMKELGEKLILKTIKQLHKKIDGLLQTTTSIIFYDNKKKCYETYQPKPRPKHLLIISYEEKLYLTLSKDNLLVIRPSVFETGQNLSQSEMKSSIIVDEKMNQQFCSHCLMEFTNFPSSKICDTHGCCFRCFILNKGQECFYCTHDV